MAVQSGGQGDVTDARRLWLQDNPKPPQRVGSGVVVDGYLYILNEPGIAWCLDPKTGEKKWEQRICSPRSWCSMVRRNRSLRPWARKWSRVALRAIRNNHAAGVVLRGSNRAYAW